MTTTEPTPEVPEEQPDEVYCHVCGKTFSPDQFGVHYAGHKEVNS